jgi:CBS domain-containing protein
MNAPRDSVPAGRLPIRSQHVLAGTGTTEVTRTVDCPEHGRVDADVCAHCASGRGEEASGPRAFVRCEQAFDVTTRDLGYAAPLEQIMTASVVCVRRDVGVDAVAQLLREHGIDAVPVVDDKGRPIGIVTKTDLFREMQLAADRPLTAGELMTRHVLWLPPEAAIASAAALMAAERIHHAIVLGADRRVFGIVSSIDLLGWLARKAGFVLE